MMHQLRGTSLDALNKTIPYFGIFYHICLLYTDATTITVGQQVANSSKIVTKSSVFLWCLNRNHEEQLYESFRYTRNFLSS